MSIVKRSSRSRFAESTSKTYGRANKPPQENHAASGEASCPDSMPTDDSGTTDVSQLQQRVSVALRCSPYHSIRGVTCDVRGRILTLRGRVPNYYMKQMAQTIVGNLLDKETVIDNQVDVERA